MNKVFKTVWNASLGVWVAVSETSSGQKKSSNKVKKSAVNTIAVVVIGATAQATSAGWAPTELNTTDLSLLLGTIGTDSIAIGSSVSDGKADASGNRAVAIGKNAKSTAVDTVSLGAGAQAIGPRSSSIGAGAVSSATDTIAIGTNATAGDGSTNTGQGAIALGASATASKQGSIAIGKGTSVTEENAIAIGAGAFSFKGAVAVGVGSSAAAGGVAINGRATGTNAVSVGTDSEAKYDNSVAVGYKSKAALNAVGIGNEAFAYAEDSVAIGRATTINATSGVGSVAIGQDNTISVKDTFVLGSNVNPNLANSVVLGAQSTLERVYTDVNNSTVTLTKADGSTQNRDYSFNYAGQPNTTSGAMSIGSKGAERQIQHVAAGRVTNTSTDAINGSQLHAVLSEVNRVEQETGWSVKGKDSNGATVSQKITNDKSVEFVANSNNIKVVSESTADGAKVSIDLANQLDLSSAGSVKMGDTLINTNGLTIGGGNPIIIQSGKVDFGGNQVKNIAQGTAGTDAVNVDQLQKYVSDNAGFTLTSSQAAGKTNHEVKGGVVDITTTGTTSNLVANQTGGKIEFALADQIKLTDAGSVIVGDSTLNKNGLQILNGPSVTTDGINAGSKVITNVAEGQAKTDAVNVGQLEKYVADNSGKWTLSGKDAAGGAYTKEIGKSTVEFAAGKNMSVVSGDTSTGAKVTIELAKDLDITDGSLKAGDVIINNNGINAGDKKITNVADGVIATGSKDAVNGGQLADLLGKVGSWDIVGVDSTGGTVDQTITTGNKVEFKAGSSKNLVVNTDITATGAAVSVDLAKDLSVDSINIGGTVNINKDGINAGNTIIKNVAAGKSPTDAVNVSQLDKTNTTVTNYFGGGSSYDPTTQDFTAPTYNVGDGSYNNVGDALEAIDNSVKNTYNYIDNVKKEMSAGIASAMAMESAPFVAGKYTYSAATAYYGGEGALGLTLRKTADNGRWSLTGGVAAGTEGDPSVRVGISGIID